MFAPESPSALFLLILSTSVVEKFEIESTMPNVGIGIRTGSLPPHPGKTVSTWISFWCSIFCSMKPFSSSNQTSPGIRPLLVREKIPSSNSWRSRKISEIMQAKCLRRLGCLFDSVSYSDKVVSPVVNKRDIAEKTIASPNVVLNLFGRPTTPVKAPRPPRRTLSP